MFFRLQISEGGERPFDHLDTVLTEEHVIVFLVKDGEPVVLKDERGLYPSDALVTQLRLLV